MLVEIETNTEKGELVLKGTADVKGPRTCYVFTGQGSVSVGMGLDLYASSPIAKQIWDAAVRPPSSSFFLSLSFCIYLFVFFTSLEIETDLLIHFAILKKTG
jgi:hypothetical protein